MLYKTLPKGLKRIYLLLIGLLLKGPIVDFITIFQVPVLEPLVTVICFILFIIGLTELLKSSWGVVASSTSVFFALWLFSYIFYPNNRTYIEENYVQFFIYVLPFFWIGYYFIKHKLYLDVFLPIAKVKLILATINQLIILLYPSLDIFDGDYMTAANSMLVGLIAVYYLAFRHKKSFDIALMIFSTFILLLSGSRGVFASILFFILVYCAIRTNFKGKLIFISFILLLLIFDFKSILIQPIASFAESIGYSTHLVDALVDQSFFEDENRKVLFDGFLNSAYNSPLGYGIMGDRYISVAHNIWHKPMYPHNFYIELIVDFGYILGSVIALVFTYYLVKGLFFINDSSFQDTVVVLASCSFLKLMFSSTFWWDPQFFMLLGVLFAMRYKYNNVQLLIR